MPTKLTIDYVNDFLEKEGYTLLDTEYLGSVLQMNMECPVGHVFPMSFKVFSKGHRCSYCAGKRQYNTEEVRKILLEYGYTLVTEKYLNNKQKLELIGPDGNPYISSFFSIKVNNIFPHTKGNKFKTEDICRNAIENVSGKKFPKVRLDFMKNPETGRTLELDGYCEELKTAFEYDGEFHFENIHEGSLKLQIKRDEHKNNLCSGKGIRLIRIPFYIKDKKTFVENEIISFGKTLYVGDPHVTVNNLPEAEKLIDFCIKTCKTRAINHIVFLGDLFDTHAVVRAEVMSFWTNTLQRILIDKFRITVLVGNHDMIMGDGPNAGFSILDVMSYNYTYNLNIVNQPTVIDGVGYLPYIHNEQDFMEKAKYLYENGAVHRLVCHQTFQGAAYENNFYAKDGFDINNVPQETVISGHIHKTQNIGKCFYPGTPKWDKSTDSGEAKGVWVVDDFKDIYEFISTEEVVTPMYTLVVTEPEEVPELNPRAKTVLELHGSSQWISKIKKQLKNKASIRSFPTDRKAPKTDASRLETVEDYATGFTFNSGVTKTEVVSYLRGLNDN